MRILGVMDKNVTLTQIEGDMLRYVEQYVEYVKSILKGNRINVEHRVSWERLVPVNGAGGTVDAWGIDGDGVCHIFDLKYGRGVEVYAEENMQTLTYATGVSMLPEVVKIEPEQYVLHIVQPRLKGPEAWATDFIRLAFHAQDMKIAYEESIKHKPTYNPSPEACHWCPALTSCPAAQFIMGSILENAQRGAVQHLRPVELSFLKNRKVVMRYFKELERKAIATILVGGSVDGFKLENKKKRRVWTDDAVKTLKLLLGDKALKDPELRSISDIRALLPPGLVDKLTYIPASTEHVLLEDT